MGLWLSPVGRDCNVRSLYLSSPSKAAQGNETKGSDHVSLSKITLVYILSLFKWHAPNPGQQLPIRVLSFGPQPIFTHRRYLYICSLLHFPPDNPLRIPSMQREGWGRGMGLGGISPYRCGWHHLPSFPLAGQQHLWHPNEMTVLSHLLGSDNEARSLSCPGSGIYWRICSTPKNSLDCLEI